MTDRWRYACPECGSRQVGRTRESHVRQYKRCRARPIDPVDLKRDRVTATEC